MQIVNISEAKSTLSKLIEKILRGEEVIIGKAGKPVAKIVPFEMNAQPRVLGAGPAGQWSKDEFWIADDFNDSEELNDLFYNDEDDELFN